MAHSTKRLPRNDAGRRLPHPSGGDCRLDVLMTPRCPRLFTMLHELAPARARSVRLCPRGTELVVAAAPRPTDLVSDSFQHAKQLRLNASDCHATGAGVCSRSVNASGSAHTVPFGSDCGGPAERDRARQPDQVRSRPRRSLGPPGCWRYLWRAGPACHDRAVSDTSDVLSYVVRPWWRETRPPRRHAARAGTCS
jgi:hypothetical protein